MFTEFLHPELVLFGNFLDPKQGCQHHIESKDGELTVHQLINRAPPPPTLLEKVERAHDEEEYELDREEEEYLRREEEEEYENDNDQGYYEDEDEEARMMHGYYDEEDEEDNLYDDGYYGYNIAGQYSPEQLAALLAGHKQKNPAKIDRIPFAKEEKKEPQQPNEDEEWQTEEQEEDYVNNQILEEAGGNFAAEL